MQASRLLPYTVFSLLSSIVLGSLWLTRPDHSLWQLLGFYPDRILWLPFSDHLLSLLIVPWLLSLVISIQPRVNTLYALASITALSLAGEILQVSMVGMTFDIFDCVAILFGAALTASIFRAQLTSNNSTHRKITLALATTFTIPFQFACDYRYCSDDKPEYCDRIIWLSWDEIRTDIVPEYGDTMTLTRPGKLLSDSAELIVVDRYTGFHLFDTSDKQNPLRIAYVPLHGVTDVTTDGNSLYANAYNDIVILPIAPLRNRTFNPGDERRIQDQITFPPYTLIGDSNFYDIRPADRDRLENGDYGVAISREFSNGDIVEYGAYTYVAEPEDPEEDSGEEAESEVPESSAPTGPIEVEGWN